VSDPAGGPGPAIDWNAPAVSLEEATKPDPADEDFQWPSVADLRPADAARLLDDIEQASLRANKRADLLKRRKQEGKALVTAVAEEYELDAIPFTNAQGKRVTYTPYEFDAFTVDDPEEFRLWAMTQNENYFDLSPKLRDGIFRDEMRRRVQDGEPLPPGVRRWTDTRLSRSARKP
jgi:hypothetical protein